MAYDVFISYRREGGLDLAGRIKDHLVLAGYNPFYDLEAMKPGRRFDTLLYEKIDECEHFLLVLPPKGLNRCRNKKDWVRKEIEYAIRQKKHIIPVLMPGFSFPKKLPPSIDVIRYVQAIIPAPETFDHTIAKIVEYLKDQNWSPIEYDDDVSRESISPIRKAIPFVAISVLLLLVIGLFLWRPWSGSGIISSNESKTASNNDNDRPAIQIGEFDSDRIVTGGNMLCTVLLADGVTIAEDNLTPAFIELDSEWTADIKIYSGDQTRAIEFSNIQGMIGYHHFTIKEGAVVDSDGNKSKSVQSFDFYLTNKKDLTIPDIAISRPRITEQTIEFDLYVSDETELESFSVDPSKLILVGFDGTVSVVPTSSADQCIIRVTDYTKWFDECYLVVPAGVAVDKAGNKTLALRSPSFSLV